MRNDKALRITFVSIIIIFLLSTVSILLDPKNCETPNEYFFKEPKSDKIFLEFFEGGDTSYSSGISNNLCVVTEKKEINDFYRMLQSLKSDTFAPHRVSDYNVFIYLNAHKDTEHVISMSCINGDYVFFFRRGKYRNLKLASKIIELLEIRKKK